MTSTEKPHFFFYKNALADQVNLHRKELHGHAQKLNISYEIQYILQQKNSPNIQCIIKKFLYIRSHVFES